MRIAIAGKGGTGKTTLAGTVARLMGRNGGHVLAIDADTNPNLATTLGVGGTEMAGIVDLPRNLMARETQADGSSRVVFKADPEQLIAQYGVRAPDNVRLIVMGKVHHGGAG